MNIQHNKNEDVMKLSLAEVRRRLAIIAEGGGKKSIQKQKERNKLTARERIDYLIDKDTTFVEIGAFVGYDMYKEQGGCPAAGTVAGIGYVSGRQCVIAANDQTVKAGAWFPISAKKMSVREAESLVKKLSAEFSLVQLHLIIHLLFFLLIKDDYNRPLLIGSFN